MANDALFMALAQARAQPSRAYRALSAGTDAVGNTVGGILQGQQIREQMDRNRMMQTPLGQIFPDPRNIPAGLGPNNKFEDLINMQPILPYIPTSAGQSVGNAMLGS